MYLDTYLTLAASSEQQLADAFDQVAQHHYDEPEVHHICHLLAGWSRENLAVMGPFQARYGEPQRPEESSLSPPLFAGPRTGSLGLLRDLHDLWLLASQVHLSRLLLSKGALALHDQELAATCRRLNDQTQRQRNWLLGRLKENAPQTLAVAD